MPHTFGPVTPEQAEAFLPIHEAVSQPKRVISHNGVEVVLHASLGYGSSKHVHDATLDQSRLALGIPNPAKTAGGTLMFWRPALREPKMTEQLRALGLPVNPRYELTPVQLNGVDMDVVTSLRYHDLPYEVRDANGPVRSAMTRPLVDRRTTTGTLIDRLTPMGHDIAALVVSGADLAHDSFNIRLEPDGQIGLYLGDLGDAEIAESDPDNYVDTVWRYSELSAEKLVEAMTQRERDLLAGSDVLKRRNNPVVPALATIALERI